MDFAGIELHAGCYRVGDSDEAGWEAVARFDSVKADRAYFGDPRDEDCWFFVSKHAVASGRFTIEPVLLHEGLTAGATYDVACKRWDGKRRLIYRGQGPTTVSSWNGENAVRSPSLEFTDESNATVFVHARNVWVAFLT